MELLRWFRFLRAVGIRWDKATRVEARDFCRWVQVATGRCGRTGGIRGGGHRWFAVPRRGSGPANAVTGKAGPGPGYAAGTVVHSERVLRGFYDFHLEAGSGPMVNPFPLAGPRGRRGPTTRWGRPRGGAAAVSAQGGPARSPAIPDERFDELFARLGSYRDRALVAFWVSTGARAAELLGATCGDVDPGNS